MLEESPAHDNATDFPIVRGWQLVVGFVMDFFKERFVHSPLALFDEQRWQLGDIARYTPSFIAGQRLGNSGIAGVMEAVDIGQTCPFVSTTLYPASSGSMVHGGGKRLIARA